MYDTFPSSAVCTVALKILRRAQDDRVVVRRVFWGWCWIMGSATEWGTKEDAGAVHLSVAFRRQPCPALCHTIPGRYASANRGTAFIAPCFICHRQRCGAIPSRRAFGAQLDGDTKGSLWGGDGLRHPSPITNDGEKVFQKSLGMPIDKSAGRVYIKCKLGIPNRPPSG